MVASKSRCLISFAVGPLGIQTSEGPRHKGNEASAFGGYHHGDCSYNLDSARE